MLTVSLERWRSSPFWVAEEVGGFLLFESLEASGLWTVEVVASAPFDDDEERCLTDYQKEITNKHSSVFNKKTLTFMTSPSRCD